MNALINELLNNKHDYNPKSNENTDSVLEHQSLDSIANDIKFSCIDTPIRENRHLNNESLASTPYLNELKQLDSHSFLAKFPLTYKIESDHDVNIKSEYTSKLHQTNSRIGINNMKPASYDTNKIESNNRESLNSHMEDICFENNFESLMVLNNIEDVEYIHQLCEKILSNNSVFYFYQLIL